MGFKSRLARLYFPERLAAKAVGRLPVYSGVVLMYHEVLPDDVDLPAWTILRESDFLWQMQYLGKHFDVVSMDEAYRRIRSKKSASRPFAVVGFDDGYKGNCYTVLPIMEEMGLPFIVYVATQGVVEKKQFWYDRIISLLASGKDLDIHVDLNGSSMHFIIPARERPVRRWSAVQHLLTSLKKISAEERESIVEQITAEHGRRKSVLKMLNSSEVKRLALSSCAAIGSHTHRHELLDQVSIEAVRETIETAEKHIAAITGVSPLHFAYPNGNFNAEVQEQLRNFGYVTAVTTGSGIWSAIDQKMAIPRIGIGRFETRAGFRALVSGWL